MMEEDGVMPEEAEQLCKHALPLVIANDEAIWCGLTSLICYKTLGEPCDNEEPVALY